MEKTNIVRIETMWPEDRPFIMSPLDWANVLPEGTKYVRSGSEFVVSDWKTKNWVLVVTDLPELELVNFLRKNSSMAFEVTYA